MIEFRHYNKNWPDGSRALSDINLNIPSGQFCVILGPSGAGKSSLLRSINGLVSGSSGEIWVAGHRMDKASEHRLRPGIGMVHQHFNLSLRLSVAKNVLAGLLPQVTLLRALSGWFTPQQRALACQMLQQVGLSPAHLHKRASELSGGQQQRVGIARAFIMSPGIVLADEPVASLDPKISSDILQLIRDTARNQASTVLCSLHQVDLARQFADRIVGMKAGRIVFDGRPEDFTAEQARLLYDVMPDTDKTHLHSNEQRLPSFELARA